MKLHKKMYADLAVLAGLVAFVLWYLADAWSASQSVENLILILPIAGLAVLLCTLDLINQLRKGPTEEHDSREPIVEIMPVMGLFAAYVLTLEWLGFDVGTLLFVSAFLWLQGERRKVWLLGYGLCFAFLVALFFSYMLPYPMPMLLLPTDY
ncbi:tripartite tricarboxylate transporter TctB family protein [Oceanospirillum sp. HFRX-1_2]